jgi:hypothetical protein
MTVKISPSVEGAPFGCIVIDAETASFIVIEISALARKNLRPRETRLVCFVYLVYLVCLVETDRTDEPDQPSPVSRSCLWCRNNH